MALLLSEREMLAVQRCLLEITGLPDRTVDWNFAALEPEARRRKARRRQRCIKTYPFGERICQDCGAVEKLERHHLIPVHLGGRNVRENLIWLCEDCHKRRHA